MTDEAAPLITITMINLAELRDAEVEYREAGYRSIVSGYTLRVWKKA